VHYVQTDKISDYSHSTNFESQILHTTNVNFYQLRRITTLVSSEAWLVNVSFCVLSL